MAMRKEDSNVIHMVCLEDVKRGGKIIYEKKNGIREIAIPEDYTKAKFYIEEEPVELDVKFLEKVARARENNLSGEENNAAYTKEEELLMGQLDNLEGLKFELDVETPDVLYEDITDTIMFDFPAISHSVLNSTSGGLWAYHGIRKFHLTISNLLEDVNDNKIKALPKLYFNKKDSKDIPAVEMTEIVLDKDAGTFEDKTYEYGVYIDTNRLGEMLSDTDQTVLFSGYFELAFRWPEREAKKYSDITYCIPIELSINNTKYTQQGKTCIANKTVSIDFGTSSSCVAVEGESAIELLTLSSNEEIESEQQQINIYENPTYIMLYRWEEIYSQWKRKNGNFPFLQRGDRMDEVDGNGVQYDFGYSVKDCMDKVSEDELNAILSEIKMIPSILHSGNHLSVRPLVRGEKPVVKLVDSPEKEDEEHFDAVAFYAYILGRAINNVAKKRIYTKFNITYPVKFDASLREKIRKSLEYGLKRSLPLPLRDAKNDRGENVLSVKMDKAEPVAYIGAICSKYLTLNDDKPELFAVFDFGGGTLDYSFGIFAWDPDDEDSTVIHVLHVDGDSNIGGETLIKRLSYWIYSDTANKQDMISNNIPFEMPAGEIIPDDFNEKLFNESMEAKSNVRKVNEAVSRLIFEGGMDEISGEAQVTLMSMNGEEMEFGLDYDVQTLNDKLREILREKVSEFHDVMDETFRKHAGQIKECGGSGYSIRQVNIYKAGNSSKNKILEELMDEAFAENATEGRVWLVDETDIDFMMDFWSKTANGTGEGRATEKKKVAITPKTAVAIGQVNLQRFAVIDKYIKSSDGGAPFAWYVGNKNAGNGSFNIKIARAATETGWVKYCKINSTDTKIYCSETRTTDGNSNSIHGIEIDLDEEKIGQFLFLRIADSNHVEYTVCKKGEVPDENSLGMKVELR